MEKNMRFGFVMTLAEKRAIERLAEMEGGLSQAALVRRLIRQAALENGLWSVQSESSGEIREGSRYHSNTFKKSSPCR